MKWSKTLALISILLISLSGFALAGKRVFFYENKVSHRIDTDYSTFKEELEKKGYNILRAEVPLSKTVIEDYNPDVIIIPGLSSQLDANELNAIATFVMKNGKGVFIIGGGQYVNQLLPFGVVVDDVELEDPTDPIMDAVTRQPGKNINEFVVKAPLLRDDPTLKALLYKVSEIGFFGGNGIYVSGDSVKSILKGDRDTSTSTGSFPPGVKPTVAIATRRDKGLIFFISDDEVLDDEHLDTTRYKYDNLRLGMNVVEWLSMPSNTPEEADIEDLRIMMGELKLDRDRLNKTLAETESERERLSSQNKGLIVQLEETEDEIGRIKDAYFLNQWSVTYSTIVILVIMLILVSAQRALARRGKKVAEENVGELGYEFEEGGEEDLDENIDSPEADLGEEAPLPEEISGEKKEK